MPHDPVRVGATRRWLRHVEIDLRSAELAISAQPPILEDALFHCQQAAEKGLKAFLVWHDEPFQKIHDLRRLGEDTSAQPTMQEAQEALQLAREVIQAILNCLPGDVRP